MTHQPTLAPTGGATFTPALDDMEGMFAGVLVSSIAPALGEDGGLIALTADPGRALAAINAYLRHMAGATWFDPEAHVATADELTSTWVTFGRSADPDLLWVMTPASEGDTRAIKVHHRLT